MSFKKMSGAIRTVPYRPMDDDTNGHVLQLLCDSLLLQRS